MELGLIKVTALKPVTESTNSTNTATLQTWPVVGCCPSLSSLSLPRQPPLHNDVAKVAGFQAIFPGNAVQQEPRTAPELAREDLSTFWADTRDSSLSGKQLAVVFDRRRSSGTKTQPTPFLRGNHPETASKRAIWCPITGSIGGNFCCHPYNQGDTTVAVDAPTRSAPAGVMTDTKRARFGF